jgi:uncharacterized protein
MGRPLPNPTADTRSFWEGCADRELRYQVCEACGTVQITPRSVCSHCQSSRLAWKRSSAAGTVLTFTTVHRAPTEAFRALAPYTIVMVDMDEGFRLMVNCSASLLPTLAIGQRVRIGFEDVDGMKLPHAEALS